jgi:UDP:flavonoid glycosyltransferase YjiC (YdhE family)
LHVLYAVSSWGLGHATRSLPLIHGLLDARCEITVVSTGRALLVLREELGASCAFLDWPETSQPAVRSPLLFYLNGAWLLRGFLATFRRDRERTAALVSDRRIDAIVSDGRYGITSDDVPSYHVGHQLHFVAPFRLVCLETWMEQWNARRLAAARRILVPDDEVDRLTGKLSHGLRFFPREQVTHLGIISPIRRLPMPPDVDVFITMSGREPQRAALERRVLSQLPRTRRRIVVSLGRPEGRAVRTVHGATVHDYLGRSEQEAYLNRSRIIVARSGYTSLMELATLGKPALLVPTPGQTEQEYLADYHRRRGTYHAVAQRSLDLERDLEAAERCPGVVTATPPDQAIRRFVDVVIGGTS